MKLYHFSFELLSPSGSAWQSDTIFGHLCWQVAYREGPAGVSKFLQPFLEGAPPFVLSDAFPYGTLPAPLIPAVHTVSATIREYAEAKRKRKAKFLSVEQFVALCSKGGYDGFPPTVDWQAFDALHASIDRNTNRTGGEGSEGALFQTTSWLPVHRDIVSKFTPKLSLFVRATERGLQSLLELLESLSALGFGRDKSTGLGHFRFEPAQVREAVELDDLKDANGFVSLSSYVPAQSDPKEGFWKLRVKRGKLGEERSLGGNPFKKPIIQIEPGAVFHAPAGTKPFYGKMLKGVSPQYDDVVQCGYSVAVPCRLLVTN